jgi:hypothetical protein
MTSHYQQQLAQQLRAAEDELGQRRRQVAELTTRAEQAEARIAAARALHQPTEFVESWTCAECSRAGQVAPDWPCPTIRALDGDTVSTDSASEPTVTLRAIGHWRPACPSRQHVAHPGASCEEADHIQAAWDTLLNRTAEAAASHIDQFLGEVGAPDGEARP